jgi:cyclic pyranopterin monophosphate synthase
MTHFDSTGRARMVDITGKPVTERMAKARGVIRMKRETLEAIRAGVTKKGDVIAVARIAGIMAAKRTSELVPLCHPIPLTDVDLTIDLDESLPGARVTASAKTAAQTGVEVEAVVAVSVTLVTIFDMVKALDRDLEIGEITVTEKHGGKSGDWVRDLHP